LSETVIDPVLVPVAIGVKITEIVQLDPALMLLPHVFVWLKSPLATMLLIASVAAPELVRMTLWALLLVPTCWEAKVTLGGESVTAGAVPEPDSATVCGLLLALSVIVSNSLSGPVVVGMNVTAKVQLAPAVTELPQVLV